MCASEMGTGKALKRPSPHLIKVMLYARDRFLVVIPVESDVPVSMYQGQLSQQQSWPTRTHQMLIL